MHESDRSRVSNPPRRQRLTLPFEKRHTDVGSWAYDHRVGLCVTVIAYLLIGIAFVSSKIVISKADTSHYIYINIDDLIEEPPVKELTPEDRKQIEDDLRNTRNVVSNENSKTIADRSVQNSGITKEIAEAADAVSDKMRASREAYERGLREEQAMIDARNAQRNRSEAKPQDAKVQGSVSVSFSLEGRTAVYIHKPSYQCEGGGEVVVDIVVNRNGNVTSVAIKSTSTTGEKECLISRALESARISRFNVDPSAPDRQIGTITYKFVPQ